MKEVERVNYLIADSENVNDQFKNKILIYMPEHDLWKVSGITYSKASVQRYLNEGILLPISNTLINF